MARRRRHVVIALAATSLVTAVLAVPAVGTVAPGRCVVEVTAQGLAGAALKTVKTSEGDVVTGPPSRTIVCGASGTPADATLVKACSSGPGGELAACAHLVEGAPTVATPFATAPVTGGKAGRAQLWCPGDVVPALAQDAIRAEAIRLLPVVTIGSAPQSTTLVNIQAVLWSGTTVRRDLPVATVLGTGVRLRVAFDHADWRFGDGEHDAAGEPGRAYDPVHDPCRTRQCPHYFGHTYVRPGRHTITMTVTWSAQFSLDGGARWTDLDRPVVGAAATHPITVREARGVLVPNPGGH